MKLLLLIGMILFISGCSSKPPLTMYKNDEQMMLKDSFVDLPMPFIYPSMNNQNYIRCFKEQFCSLFPEFKESDFKKMNHPWSIMTYQTGYSIGVGQVLRDKGIVLSYDISFHTKISPYSKEDKALEEKNEKALKEYYNSYVGKKLGTGATVTIPRNIKYYGKENYACSEAESYRGAENGYPVETYIKNISCGKINSDRTKVKTVDIKLVYQKIPNLLEEYEELAKDYTYENLQERAKRMLDSLYIKDGWDE